MHIFCVLKWRNVNELMFGCDPQCKVTFWCQKMPYIFLVSVFTPRYEDLSPCHR